MAGFARHERFTGTLHSLCRHFTGTLQERYRPTCTAPTCTAPTCAATSAKLALALAVADEFRDAIAADALLRALAEAGEAAGGLATASCNYREITALMRLLEPAQHAQTAPTTPQSGAQLWADLLEKHLRVDRRAACADLRNFP